MDHHIKEYYSQFHDETPRGNFHRVIPLHEEKNYSWEEVTKLIPNMSKGWFELAHLDVKDRIDFTRDFWLSKLPYHPKLDAFIMHFFESLDDIGIFMTQRTFDDPFEAHMVYGLKRDECFFRGALPATESELTTLREEFPEVIFPADYLAFLQIHNGFAKTTDVTGITPISEMAHTCGDFQALVLEEGILTTAKGTSVDPKKLIPFYVSFGMPFYQCFWAEWYPEQEMGNVYYSDLTKTISNVECSDPSAEGMAFPTFLDWLMFYMEQIQ